MSVLGISYTMLTHEEVHEAYIAALRRYHPDHNHHPEAGRRTAEITEAYHSLKTSGLLTNRPAAPRPAGDRSEPPIVQAPTVAPPESDELVVTLPTVASDWILVGQDGNGSNAGFCLRLLADDTIEFDLPPDLTAQYLQSAAQGLGEIIYLERTSGLMQLLVRFVDQPICQVILDLQGRAPQGTTEVFCSVASMDDRPPPPIEAVTRFVADRLVHGPSEFAL